MSDDIASLVIEVKSDSVEKAKRSLADLTAQGKKAEQSLGNLNTGATKAESSLSSMAGSVKTLIGVYAGLNTVIGLAKISDEYTKYNAQLKIATGSQREFTKALDDVRAIATTAQVSVSSISTLYSRLNLALRDVGVSQGDVAKISETVALSLKVAGASAAESSSAMLQLSQAFGSGVLRGEEFNAMMESAPNLMRALAESIGVPVGQLRSLASEGQITSDVLTKAFTDEKLLNALRGQAKEVETMGGAWQVVKDSIEGAIGRLVQYLELSKRVNEKASLLAQVFAPETANDKRVAARKEIERLQGRAGSIYSDNYRQKLINEQLRILDSTLGNKLPVTDTSNQSFSPNFNATVVKAADGKGGYGQDVSVINRRIEQENRERLARQKQYDSELEAQRKKALDAIQYDIDFEQDLLEAKYKTEIEAEKQIAKLKEEAARKEQESIQRQIAIRQDMANRNFEESQRETRRIEEERLKEFENSINGINQVFREGFANMVNGGKTTWKSFTKSLVTTFKTTVADAIYRMFAQPFVVKIVASLLGVTGANIASAADISGTNATNAIGFQTLADGLSQINTNLVGSIEKLGAFLSTGSGGLGDTIGGFLGQYANQIATGLSFLPALTSLLKGDIKGAAFQGGGAAIGAILAGPIGGAIGSFLGGAIGKLFGGGSYKRYGTTVSGVFEDGAYRKTGQGIIYDRSLGGGDALDGLNKSFTETLGKLFSTFDVNEVIRVTSGQYQRGKSKVSGGVFSAAVGGEGFKFSVSGKKWSQQKVFEELVNKVFTEGVIQAVRRSDLATGIKSFFEGITKKDEMFKAISDIVRLGEAEEKLRVGLNVTAEQIALLAKESSIAGDNFTKLVDSLTTTAESTITVGQRLIMFKQGLEDTLGFDLPDTLKIYDETIKGINKTTQEGRQEFLKLISLRDTFKNFSDGIDQLKTNVNAAIFDILSPSEQLAKRQEGLKKIFESAGLGVPSGLQELKAIGDSIDYTTSEGLDLALLFPALVKAFTDTREAVDGLIDSMKDINEFSNIVDFNRYKGLATNYGTDFANRVLRGESVSYGSSNNTTVSLGAISPSNNTTISTSDPNLLDAIRVLTAKVEALQLAADKSAMHSKRAADVLVNVSPNGNTIQTEVAA